ncbi:MAG: gas vesicle protein GvpG, partial [Chloroflexi bacterium CG_4_9_14_3_um_filter_45_9]
QLLLQDGEVSEKEYEELEAKLIERLRAVREHQRGV